MKYKIKYYYIKSDHIFATPEYDYCEVVIIKNNNKEIALDKYIATKKDQYGFKFKKEKKSGFDYISKQGAIKIVEYKHSKLKIINI